MSGTDPAQLYIHSRECGPDRVRVLSLADGSARWLSEKLLDPDSPDSAAARDAIRDFVDRERGRGAEVRLNSFEPSGYLERLVGDGRLVVAGSERVYESSDSILDARYVGFRPADLIKAVQASGLHYDPDRKVGAVLHLMSPVTEHGKFGAACIGRDRAYASQLMRELRELVHGLGEGTE